MADQDTKEILGFTKESLMIWSGFALCIGALAIIISFDGGFLSYVGIVINLVGLVLIGYGVVKDFKKPNLRALHLIGNVMVILFWLLFAVIFVLFTYGVITQ